MLIKKLTNKVIEKFIVEINEPCNMNKLKKGLLNPLINYTYQRLFPYFLATTIVFLLTFILALLIFLLLLRQIMKNN